MAPSFWDQVARLPGYSPVVDYQPQETPWARYVTALHLGALSRAIHFGPQDRFCDFGCGVGRITTWLGRRAAMVTALDSSATMIDEARKRHPATNVQYGHLTHRGADLPLGSCDGLTAVWVLQHILTEAELAAAVTFFSAAVKKGGSVYAIDRLCLERVDHDESTYLKLRCRTDYRAVFTQHGWILHTSYPISINEQVLGHAGLTRLAQTHKIPRLTSWLDLAWARRQPDPYLADYLHHFVRQ